MTRGKLASISTKIIVLTPMPGKSRGKISLPLGNCFKERVQGLGSGRLQFLYSHPQPWAGRRSASELWFPQVSTRNGNNYLKELSGGLSSRLFHCAGKMEHRSHCCPVPPNLGGLGWGLGCTWINWEMPMQCPAGCPAHLAPAMVSLLPSRMNVFMVPSCSLY